MAVACMPNASPARYLLSGRRSGIRQLVCVLVRHSMNLLDSYWLPPMSRLQRKGVLQLPRRCSDETQATSYQVGPRPTRRELQTRDRTPTQLVVRMLLVMLCGYKAIPI